MIQFNLLPDVKLEYVKARRAKYLMTFISFIVAGTFLGIFLFSLFLVKVVQVNTISNLDKDVKRYSKQLQSVKDLDKILTVQNQLNSLPGLHEKKVVSSRLFTYIPQITPDTIGLDKLEADFTATTLTVGGKASNFDSIKVFTSTLKKVKYTSDNQGSPKSMFSEVSLSSFSKNETETTFTIAMKYDPAIFDIKENVTLVVPSGAYTNQDNLFGAGS